MEATLREDKLLGPAECKLPSDVAEEPTEPKGTDEQGWATEAPASENKTRLPTSSPTSAECAGGRGTGEDGKEEEPGAGRTGGGQTDERDDRRQDTTGQAATKPSDPRRALWPISERLWPRPWPSHLPSTSTSASTSSPTCLDAFSKFQP